MRRDRKNIVSLAAGVLAAAALLCGLSAVSFAEVKTGGDYEVMFDVVGSGEIATASAGDLGVYSVIGQSSGYEMLTGGINEVVGGFLGVVDEIPPTIIFKEPVRFSTHNNVISAAGTAFDENNVQWTLFYGPGETPAAWKQIGAGDANLVGGDFGSWDATNLHGPYTLAVVAVDSRGNIATGTVTFNIGNSVTVAGTIPKFKWLLVSVPADPTPSDPMSMYGSTQQYKVYRWNPEKAPIEYFNQYEYPPVLAAGNAYWIFSYYQPLPYSFTGTPTDTTKDYEMKIKNGWNQIGTPFDREYPWDGVRVRGAAAGCELSCDMATAVAKGLLSRTLFEYDSDAKSWRQNTDPPVNMTSRKGYFLRAYGDITLLFSPNANMPGGLARVVRTPYDYRAHISAIVGDTADADNYLGVTQKATQGFDSYDAEEPPRSPDDKYVSLYFPRDDWGRMSGKYANDVRNIPTADGATDKWTFVVETNVPDKMVSLKWDGPMPVDRYAFHMIHEETGQSVDMAARNSYDFAAMGAVSKNHFRVEVTKLSSAQVTRKYRLKSGWNLVSMPVEPEVTSARSQLGDNLKALNVYQLFDGKFYTADKADIQAGLGYWIFVEQETDIDITGREAAAEIRVPVREGWNLIGDPYETDVQWNDSVFFVCGDVKYSIAQAAASNITDGKLFAFDGVNYTPAAALVPWKGFALKMNRSCDLALTKQ